MRAPARQNGGCCERRCCRRRGSPPRRSFRWRSSASFSPIRSLTLSLRDGFQASVFPCRTPLRVDGCSARLLLRLQNVVKRLLTVVTAGLLRLADITGIEGRFYSYWHWCLVRDLRRVSRWR